MLALVVLDLRDNTITFNVHLIFLDPRLPVLALAVPSHALLVLTDHRCFFVIVEVVSNLTPHLDVLQASCRTLSRPLLHPLYLFKVLRMRYFLVGFLQLLGT